MIICRAHCDICKQSVQGVAHYRVQRAREITDEKIEVYDTFLCITCFPTFKSALGFLDISIKVGQQEVDGYGPFCRLMFVCPWDVRSNLFM